MPELENISGLSLPDLKKLKKSLESYYGKYRNNEIENKKIIDANRRSSAIWKKQVNAKEEEVRRVQELYLFPAWNAWHKLNDEIRKHSSSGLYTIFGGYTQVGDYKVPANMAKRLQSNYDKALKEIENAKIRLGPIEIELNTKKSQYYSQKTKPSPNDSTTLKIGGVNLRVHFRNFKLEVVNEIIQSKEAALRKENEREKEALNEIKARAAYKENKVRSQVSKYRNDFGQQKNKLNSCPYCGTILNQSDAHLDHIYPVSKGGLSVRKNLVFVCPTCNQKKGNMTLRNFITKFQLDLHLIYERLDKLSKDF